MTTNQGGPPMTSGEGELEALREEVRLSREAFPSGPVGYVRIADQGKHSHAYGGDHIDALLTARAATDAARKPAGEAKCTNQMPSGTPACISLPLDACPCREAAQRDARGVGG